KDFCGHGETKRTGSGAGVDIGTYYPPRHFAQGPEQPRATGGDGRRTPQPNLLTECWWKGSLLRSHQGLVHYGDRQWGIWPTLERRQLEFTHRVLERNALAHRFRNSCRVEKFAGFGGLLERIVGGEHHPIVAERCERAVERLGRVHARRGHDEIL